jgi:hypothetical protein
MDSRKFYVNIDAGLSWYNDNVAVTGSGIEKVNRDKLGRYVFGSYYKKENDMPKISKWQNKTQIPTLEQWFSILEFLTPPNVLKADVWIIQKDIQEILICYYD